VLVCDDRPGGDAGAAPEAESIAVHLCLPAERHRPPEAVFAAPAGPAAATAKALARSLGLPNPQPRDELAEAGPVGAWSLIEAERDAREADATVVLVCGEALVRGLVCHALGMRPEDGRRFALAPGSLTTIEFRGPRTLIASLNETCHLEAATGRPQATQGPK